MGNQAQQETQDATQHAPPQKAAPEKQLPAATRLKRSIFGYDPAKQAQKAQQKAVKDRSKQAAKDAKNLAGPSLYSDLAEMKSLCEKYRNGIQGLEPDDAIEVMKKIYLHLKTGRLDKETTSSLYNILERLYLRPGVIARAAQLSDPVVAKGMVPFMNDVISRSAGKMQVPPADYIALARRKPDMIKLEDDQIVRMARIIGKSETDPIGAINRAFGVAQITLPERAALMLELNSKNIIPKSTVVLHYNQISAELGTYLSQIQTQTTDAATLRVFREMETELVAGKVGSADEAVVAIFKNEAVREDLRKALGPGSKALLEELSNATTLKEMEAVLKGVGTTVSAPASAQDFIAAMLWLARNEDLAHNFNARRVLDQSTTEIANAIRAANMERAKFARGLRPALSERAEDAGRGALRLGRFVASPVGIPGAAAVEEFSEARVSGVRPRRILRGVGYGLVTAGMVLLSYQAVKYFTWGRTAREREAAREILQKTWGVNITLDTARRMKDSPLAENFFMNWFEFRKSGKDSKIASELVPRNEKQLAELLKSPGIFINPARINDLAAEVDAQIKTLKQKDKSDGDIEEVLDERVRGDWRAKGYFLTPGELFIESFGRDLNLKREVIDYLKATVTGNKDTSLFTLLWSGMRDGSLPRTFAAAVALELFADAAALAKVKDAADKRSRLGYGNLPSVRDSLAQAGIESPYLLSTPIPAGSLMDFYDQYAVASHDKAVQDGFRKVLEQYSSDPEVAKRLNAFKLVPGEEVYGNVANIVRRVAEGTLSLADARAQHIIADDVFARLGILDKGLIEFVYQNSGEKGAGMLQWLRDNRQHIQNGPEMVKYFQRQRALFIGGTLKEKYEICEKRKDQLLKDYVKEEEEREGLMRSAYRGGKSLVTGKPPAPLPERWYVRTTEPFMSWTPRDVVPRDASLVGKETPKINTESEALLRTKLGEMLYPGKNEAQWSAAQKRAREAVFKSIADKAVSGDAAGSKALADAGIATEAGPVGIVIKAPEPESKKFVAFQAFVTAAEKAELATVAVEAALGKKIIAALAPPDKQYAPAVTRAIADMIMRASDKERADLSAFGIKVTQRRTGLSVKVPKATEEFQSFVASVAAEVRK